jgi:hypothetical protein
MPCLLRVAGSAGLAEEIGFARDPFVERAVGVFVAMEPSASRRTVFIAGFKLSSCRLIQPI